MKIPGSLKFILVTSALGAAIYGGWRAYGEVQLANYHPAPVKPGVVTILAVDAGGRFKILVQNQVAVLQEVPKNMNQKSAGADEGGTRKRLPIRELLQSLQGNEAGLGRLVMSLNNLSDDILPRDEVDWTAAELEKAFAGDAALTAKLEQDIGLRLSGIPSAELRLRPLLRGIVLQIPVPVRVDVEGKMTTLQAPIKEPFQTRLGSLMEKEISGKFNPSKEAMIGYFREFANNILASPEQAEDIRAAIRSRMSRARLASLAEPAESVLSGATVVMNDSSILGASSTTYEGPNQTKLTDLTIRLSDDGKMRLWKYSHNRAGFQLMLIIDGIAIAAPKISTELAQNEVTITQIANQTLAEDAVKRMNDLSKKGN